MTYPESLAWLYATQLTGVKLGLANMRRLIEAQGGQPPGRFVHVAGTNGKGSVCAMIDAVARAGGWRSGLFTSPHLVTFRERIRVGGEMISEAGVAEGLTRLRGMTQGWNPEPTFFELATALALDWFRERGVDVVAWETGLGGRLDATNAIDPAATVLTEIGLDHQAYLGETIEEITAEKAGIIKPGKPVVSGPQSIAAAGVIARVAARQGATLRVVVDGTGMEVGLPGAHQRVNAALALAALDAAEIAVDEPARRQGLAGVEWPGRFQRLEEGRIILDGAHNPAAAQRLAATWAEEFPAGEKPAIILGILGDKDAAEICRALAPVAGNFVVTPVRSPRAGEPGPLLEWARATGVESTAARDLPEALALARGMAGPILVTGSLFLVGEALACLTQPGGAAPEWSWQ